MDLIVAHEVLLSMWFPRQRYWSGLPFPSPVNERYSNIKFNKKWFQWKENKWNGANSEGKWESQWCSLGRLIKEIYTQGPLKWLSHNLSMEQDREKKKFFFSPTQLPEDEISNMVSLSQRDIIIWFWCIFPTKGNAACPRKHIYLEFLKDTELRQTQNKGFRWQTWDISWWAEWQVKSGQIYLSIYHLLRTYDMPRA